MFWYNKTLVEFDLVQHQISFAGSSDVRLSFASPSITCPGKTNLMLDSVSSNKCFIMYTVLCQQSTSGLFLQGCFQDLEKNVKALHCVSYCKFFLHARNNPVKLKNSTKHAEPFFNCLICQIIVVI